MGQEIFQDKPFSLIEQANGELVLTPDMPIAVDDTLQTRRQMLQTTLWTAAGVVLAACGTAKQVPERTPTPSAGRLAEHLPPIDEARLTFFEDTTSRFMYKQDHKPFWDGVKALRGRKSIDEHFEKINITATYNNRTVNRHALYGLTFPVNRFSTIGGQPIALPTVSLKISDRLTKGGMARSVGIVTTLNPNRQITTMARGDFYAAYTLDPGILTGWYKALYRVDSAMDFVPPEPYIQHERLLGFTREYTTFRRAQVMEIGLTNGQFAFHVDFPPK